MNNKGKLKGDRTDNITWQQNIDEITNLIFDASKGLILYGHNNCSFWGSVALIICGHILI